ncbi:MAG TPA: hypothetical protein PK006_05880 [Saprospiraceae bacterium]|nr:hypothetical protein [Saprospiraceae bacterium]
MKNSVPFLFILLLSLLIQSCASVSQYQTAKPAGEGNTIHRISINGNIKDDGGTPPYIVEYGINYGVSNKLDFIGKINIWGSLSFGAKYTVLGSQLSKSALAVGPTMNIFGRIINLTLPVHFTIEPSDLFSFTVTPSYTTPGLYKVKFDADPYYKNINTGYWGLSPYIEASRRVKFIFGVNLSFTKEALYTDYGFGVRIPGLTSIFNNESK